MKVLISNWLLNSKISQSETLKLLKFFFFFFLVLKFRKLNLSLIYKAFIVFFSGIRQLMQLNHLLETQRILIMSKCASMQLRHLTLIRDQMFTVFLNIFCGQMVFPSQNRLFDFVLNLQPSLVSCSKLNLWVTVSSNFRVWLLRFHQQWLHKSLNHLWKIFLQANKLKKMPCQRTANVFQQLMSVPSSMHCH